MQTGSIGEMGDSNDKASAADAASTKGSSNHAHAAHLGANGNVIVPLEKGALAIEKTDRLSSTRVEPIIITVENNLDKAMKILKRKLIKEGLFKELKTRRYFEKPSVKKKRKQKETVKKNRKEEARIKKSTLLS